VTVVTQVRLETTKVYRAILQAFKDGKKGICLEGGTYSSKTYSALQALITIASSSPYGIDINVVCDTVPHLKGGAIRDFFRIMDESPDTSRYYIKTDRIYAPGDWKGAISFLSADNEKALGMRREILYINEADTLSWETAKQLISRTEVFTILDWNPRSRFWAHEYFVEDPQWAYDHSTYTDALDVIPKSKADEILSLGRKDPNYQNVYVLGLMGKIEGLVHPSFDQVDMLPGEPDCYGLDFGALGDPTVLTAHVIKGDHLYSRELFYIYDAEITNQKISMHMRATSVNPHKPIYPDPDEPKSATELRQLGWYVGETVKGKGSVEFGIKAVNNYYQHWTKDSLNCIKEQKNYSYIKRRDPATGEEYFSDDTTHVWSHGMDSRRYAVASHTPQTLGRQIRPTKYGIRGMVVVR